MRFASVPLPFGMRVTIAYRSRPLGIALTLWTRREQQECRLVRANRTETLRHNDAA